MSAGVALVTGGNRGIGRETCRQLAAAGWTVVLAARSGGEAAAAELGVAAVELDVTSEEQAWAAGAWVRERYGRLDALVNNAGAVFDPPHAAALTQDLDGLRRSFEVNALGALIVTRAMAPLLRAYGGNVVNVSSGMGAVTDMGGGWAGYRLSKAALNALTRVLHAELHPRGVRVNAVCPGWVQTDLGGAGAPRTVEAGAAGVVWAATLPASGPSGGFFRDGQPIAW